MPGIFISYRRESTAGVAGRLFDRLCAKFGKDRMFIDVDMIEPGEDFVEVLERKLADAIALVVLIGPDWLTCKDASGSPRLDNPDDFVRLEVATALKRSVRVIPVLLDDARMPPSQLLPADLVGLGRRQSIEIRHARFHQDVEPLVNVLEKLIAAQSREAEHSNAESILATVREVAPKAGPRAGETKVNPKDGQIYVWIPPGKFTMGCSPGDNECYPHENPPREVTIAQGFWMGQTPVTQRAYERVIGTNPSRFKGSDRPVETVTWMEAEQYCKAIGMRLPTEAEWEYAARGGINQARYGNLSDIAWFSENSGGKPHDVKQLQPNAYGLYDMLGNVWEWTASWYEEGKTKALRGGSWDNDPRNVRVSGRDRVVPANRVLNIGFRCVGE
jgi:formylglycine-generating enzyme required for sulfatase activity